MLGEYYFGIQNYDEARRWYEPAAEEGDSLSLCRLGIMLQNGQEFDQNASRLLTISVTLHQGFLPALHLAPFFFDSNLPLMLHYLRPAVEGGHTNGGVIVEYALGLLRLADKYYGQKCILMPGYNPVPEALFWFRRGGSMEEYDADHPLVQLEGNIRKMCAHCAADLPECKKSCCVECKAAYYCGRDCQMAHWKAGHKKDCVRKLKKRLRAEGKLDEET